MATDCDPANTAGIETQFLYDNWGRTVGSKTTGDTAWTCTTFDVRGRTVQVSTPAFGTGVAVTTSTTYAVGGDPRVTSVTDGVHTNTSTLDTLGRVVSATDSLGTVTTTTYEQGTGRVLTATSTPVGGGAVALAYSYDLDGKVVSVTRNGSLSATVNYDPVTYSYDGLGRLTTATLSDQTFTYGFDAVAACSTSDTATAGLNGNRTTQTRTVNGVTTTDTYCYDSGDRLTAASQVNGTIVYDQHGNITQLGDTTFTYDSLDRHISTTLPTGQVTTLERDIDGSVLSRTVSTPNQAIEVVKYSNGVVQFYLNSANQVTGTTQSLPGGVSVTDANSTSTTTFTSLQGNACLTVNAGTTTRTRFDPFGTPLTALPDTLPGSAEAGFGTVAGKLTDTLSPLGLIEMGARLYSTVLGRFLQVDPVPGGGVNAYSYPPDPLNASDYTGESFESTIAWTAIGVALVAACALCAAATVAAIGAGVGLGIYFSDLSGESPTVEGAISSAVLGGIPIGIGRGIKNPSFFRTLWESKTMGPDSKLLGNFSIATRGVPEEPGGILNSRGRDFNIGWRTQSIKPAGISSRYVYFGISMRLLKGKKPIHVPISMKKMM